jgi:ABC-type multidrug transport system fused ATPase/permease subunit
VSIFFRLLGFLRPYRSGAVWSVVLAALATGGTVAIPWLTGRAIDAVSRGDDADV